MPSILVMVQLLAIVVLLVSCAETFRQHPWWPHPIGRSPDRPPPRGSSPGERRWLHAGLALLLAGNVLTLTASEEQPAGWAAMLLLLLGLAGVVTGLVRGPTEQELARYRAERQAADDDA